MDLLAESVGGLDIYFLQKVVYDMETLWNLKLVFYADKHVLYRGKLSYKDTTRLLCKWQERYAIIYGHFLLLFADNKNRDQKPKDLFSFKTYDRVSKTEKEESSSQKQQFLIKLSSQSGSDVVHLGVSSYAERKMLIVCFEASIDFCKLRKIKQRCKETLVRELLHSNLYDPRGENLDSDLDDDGYVRVPPPSASQPPSQTTKPCKGFTQFKYRLGEMLTEDTVIKLARLFEYPEGLIGDLRKVHKSVGHEMVTKMAERGEITPTGISYLLDMLRMMDYDGCAHTVQLAFEECVSRPARYDVQEESDETSDDESLPYSRDIYGESTKPHESKRSTGTKLRRSTPLNRSRKPSVDNRRRGSSSREEDSQRCSEISHHKGARTTSIRDTQENPVTDTNNVDKLEDHSRPSVSNKASCPISQTSVCGETPIPSIPPRPGQIRKSSEGTSILQATAGREKGPTFDRTPYDSANEPSEETRTTKRPVPSIPPRPGQTRNSSKGTSITLQASVESRKVATCTSAPSNSAAEPITGTHLKRPIPDIPPRPGQTGNSCEMFTVQATANSGKVATLNTIPPNSADECGNGNRPVPSIPPRPGQTRNSSEGTTTLQATVESGKGATSNSVPSNSAAESRPGARKKPSIPAPRLSNQHKETSAEESRKTSNCTLQP